MNRLTCLYSDDKDNENASFMPRAECVLRGDSVSVSGLVVRAAGGDLQSWLDSHLLGSRSLGEAVAVRGESNNRGHSVQLALPGARCLPNTRPVDWSPCVIVLDKARCTICNVKSVNNQRSGVGGT